MKQKAVFSFMLAIILLFAFVLSVRFAQAAFTVHFTCESISLGSQGSITFSGTTYTSGQTGNYVPGNYQITGNPPSPTPDNWVFGWWVVMSIGSTSWVDNPYSSTTTLHMNGEVYLTAEFYTPIHANNPSSPITWGTRQRITGTAGQCFNGESLTIAYYTHGSGMGPPHQDGTPPFGGSGGYFWKTVTVSSGGWDTGLIYPTLPISLNQQLPQTYDVYAIWGSGAVNEQDSNVVSFLLNPASAQIAAPILTPNSIELGETVTVTDQIFSSALVNQGDMTGTLTVQAKKQGTGSWTDVASQVFTSTYGYSSIYGQYGVFYDLAKPWTPTETGIFDVRVVYSGNNLYLPINNPSTSTLVVSLQKDFGISLVPTYKSVEGAGSVEYTVIVTSINDFNSAVSLAASIDPSADISSSFNPPSVTPPAGGSGQSVMLITTRSSTPLNEYVITVTASGATKQHSTQTLLSVSPRSRYNIVFIPLNWQGDLATFSPEVDAQASFLIDNIDALTWQNTGILKMSQSLTLSFDKTEGTEGPPATGWRAFKRWSDIQQFALNNGFTGDRYVALTNEDIWGSVGGQSNGGNVVVVEQGASHITAHELGHSWGLLDEYKYQYWLDKAIRWYNYPTGFPPNSYPGDDPDLDPGQSWGRSFDGHRCIMGPSNTADFSGVTINKAFCPFHTKDEGPPVGVRSYVGCSAYIDSVIQMERSQVSAGLVSSVITFYRDGTTPTIHEMVGIGSVGKPDICYRPQDFSLQVYSQTGTMLYSSNISTTFWLLPSQPVDGNAEPFEVDSVTVTWVTPAFYQEAVNVTLRDNITNQTVASQDVTLPPIVPDLSLVNIVPSKVYVGQGYKTEINVDIQNKGTAMATANLTLYANNTYVGSRNVTVGAGNMTTFALTWNTTGFICGNYTLSAHVLPLPGETNTIDNTLISGLIRVTTAGDANGDKSVNVFDILAVKSTWGTSPNSPNWIPEYDVNDDLLIDVFDILEIKANWGES